MNSPRDEKQEFSSTLRDVEAYLARQTMDQPEETLLEVCRLMKEGISHYSWVGFYLAGPEETLHLGPYAGTFTIHDRIPKGKGVCGLCWEENAVQVVQDVTQQGNYLACSLSVKSEIVVPLQQEGTFIAEIDIDSHEKAPFSEEDVNFLKKIADLTLPWAGKVQKSL